MSLRFLPLALGVLALSGVASAAVESYTIEPTHTYPKFEYNHLGFSYQIGRFDNTSGTITLDSETKTGSAKITIDTNSINMGSDKFNAHLKSDDFFNVAKYPTITFQSSKFIFEKEALKEVIGDLTIKGITKPTTLKVSHFHCGLNPIVKKQVCGANATAQIKRSDFNIDKYAPHVSNEVSLTISIEALKDSK